MKLPKIPKDLMGLLWLPFWWILVYIFNKQLPQDASMFLKIIVLLGTLPPIYAYFKIFIIPKKDDKYS